MSLIVASHYMSSVDLVANEAKYHNKCATVYKNEYSSFLLKIPISGNWYRSNFNWGSCINWIGSSCKWFCEREWISVQTLRTVREL